jgi:hypothetical protein
MGRDGIRRVAEANKSAANNFPRQPIVAAPKLAEFPGVEMDE